MRAWRNFKEGNWQKQIDVENFILENYKEYRGSESFLEEPTEKTKHIWYLCGELLKKEREKGVLDVDLNHVSGITSFKPGYIDKDSEVIVGLQTDEPLKRIINPFSGIKTVKKALESYGYEINPTIDKCFTDYRKTLDDGVFDAYTDQIKKACSNGLIVGLPDSYGGIIGDYRRIALYGTDILIAQKLDDLSKIKDINEENIRLREEVSDQIKALKKLEEMASSYGFDIKYPAKTAKEAVQWLYFGYLAAVKENNGASISLGRTSTFLDIYIERDLEEELINEIEAQELIDQFIIKLRLVRHLRTPDYEELFAGDPTLITESIGGLTSDGRSLITKTSFRYLHTLINLGPNPEPNLTILWSEKLPEPFKKYCASITMKTDAIQYENDDIMRPIYGDDYGITCCVSAMNIGRQMKNFKAGCNLAKALLYTINGGYDEISKKLVIEGFNPIKDTILDYETVKNQYYKMLERVASIYVDCMNIISYMHDKYAYETIEMALYDTDLERFISFGVAGLSVAADSLSAIKFAKVKPIRDENGIAIDFEVVGDYPKYGNDDDRVDDIAVNLVMKFINELKKHPLYRDSKHTLSVSTITSNIVYGKKTGSTPDGRKNGAPFAPGANSMHNRDNGCALASLNSVAKIPYEGVCQDGISNTFSIVPDALGDTISDRIDNLVKILDGYFFKGAHHLNINVMHKELLIDAMNNPLKYPTLTIGISGYAVNFNRLSKEQQLEVISRTFHERI